MEFRRMEFLRMEFRLQAERLGNKIIYRRSFECSA
jgi:hypothetical protein